jgi:hypothetical protein
MLVSFTARTDVIAHPVPGTLHANTRESRLYHPLYPVRVPRPAPSLHAAFRPHLAVTPWRFPGPSAPCTPGQGTCTPEHNGMHGTHAAGQRPAEPVRWSGG